MKYFIDAALRIFAFEDADTDEFIAQYAQQDWTLISNIPMEPPKPAIDPITQSVIRDGCALVDGQWQYKWRVVELFETQAERDAAVSAHLAGLKFSKNTEINAARLVANFSTFTHAGKQFACDQLSRSDIDGTNGFVSLYGVLPTGWPGGWKAVDNTYTAIATVDAWKSFYSSMFAAGSANFLRAQALKAQLDSATTAEQVSAIAW